MFPTCPFSFLSNDLNPVTPSHHHLIPPHTTSVLHLPTSVPTLLQHSHMPTQTFPQQFPQYQSFFSDLQARRDECTDTHIKSPEKLVWHVTNWWDRNKLHKWGWFWIVCVQKCHVKTRKAWGQWLWLCLCLHVYLLSAMFYFSFWLSLICVLYRGTRYFVKETLID